MAKVVSLEESLSREIFEKALAQDPEPLNCFKCKKRNCESCDDNHSFYASWAGMCKRRIAYNWLYGDTEVEDELHLRFLIGKLWHGGLQALLLEKDLAFGIEKKKRIRRKGGFILSCKADALIDGAILEIKTVKAQSIGFVPFKSNILQLEVAMEIFGVDKGELIYVPVYDDISKTLKNFENWRFYSFKRAGVGKEVIREFQEIFKLLKKNKLPKREISANCSACSKNKVCFKEGFAHEFLR